MLLRSPALRLAVLALLWIHGPALAAQPTDAPPLAELALRPITDLLVAVDLDIGGETYPFLLDTGGGITVVTPTVAEATGCRPFGRGTGFRHNGERLDLPRCLGVPLAFGDIAVRPEAGVFDLDALGLPGFGGLLALQSFEEHSITIDLRHHRLVLESPESLAERVRGAPELSIRAAHQASGAALDYFVEVEAATGNLWLELDSGNTQPVLLSPHAYVQLGLALPEGEAAPVTLDVVGLGPTELTATARDSIYDGLLNAQFFADHVVTFDLANHRLWARPND